MTAVSVFSVQRILSDHNLRLEAVLSLGMIDEHPAPHGEKDLSWEKVHQEKWPQIFRA